MNDAEAKVILQTISELRGWQVANKKKQEALSLAIDAIDSAAQLDKQVKRYQEGERQYLERIALLESRALNARNKGFPV